MRSQRPVPLAEAPADVLQLPLFSSRISAGFPSPADDHLEQGIDLNQLLVLHPAATFYLRVSGHSMIGEGVHDGDILIVDCSLSAQQGDVIIAEVEGEFTVKKLNRVNGAIHLEPANPKYRSIVITPDMEDARIFGVVTYVLHKPGRRRK